jgi:thiamine pyrophosphokinase
MHAVIVSNGFPPSKELLKKEAKSANILIGADGGGNKILERGLTPDVVIGDMDSFQRPEECNFEIIHEPDQETNDLEKALKLALKNGATSCHVLGSFGMRMDHSLKNLSVMKQFSSSFEELIFRDERFDAFLITKQYSGEIPVGNVVSLFPLSGEVKGITTTGLKYALAGESLINGQRDGTSNETMEPEFSVEVAEGDLVLFIER